MSFTLLAFLAAALYALNAPLSKLLLQDVSPAMMAAFLYLGAGIGLLAIGLIRSCVRRQPFRLHFTRKDAPYVVGMTALDVAAPILLMLAKIEPEILCQTLKMAPGRVARGLAAKFAAARETARPLFCIPTSMEIAVALSYSTLKSFATSRPRPMPSRLCSTTTTRQSTKREPWMKTITVRSGSR